MTETGQPNGGNRWRDALPVGTVVAAYEIEARLGAGGFGVVYRVRHQLLDSVVALKEYFPVELAVREENTVHPRSTDCREAFEVGLYRFRDEAKRLIELNDHPAIVGCRDFFLANGTAYLVMECVDGLPLSELLRRRESRGDPLGERELLAIAVPLLDGLKRVHEHGVFHRDIKPSNILIRKADEQPVLIDFGAAKQKVAEHTKSLAPYTDGFAALEQVADGELGTWTDMYGLGAVLWRIVAGGNPPWEPLHPVKVERRANALLLRKPDPLPPATRLGAKRFSNRLLKAIDKCLALNHADRVQASEDLLHEFLIVEKARSDGGSRWLQKRALNVLAWAISVGVWKPDLHNAASYGRMYSIRALVASGADVNVRDELQRTPLHRASQQGHMPAIEALLAAGADLHARDKNGKTPLHQAACSGKAKAITALIGAGADPDERNSAGGTPLHRAARRGHTTAVETLIEAGADLLAWDEDGDTPLHRAAFSDKPKEAIEALLKAGCDPSIRDDVGRTPLHMAANYGLTSAVEALLEGGADMLARNKYGNTPLHSASALDRGKEAIEALLKTGCDPSVRNDKGRTPLHVAAQEGLTTTIEALLGGGADVLARDQRGDCPLHAAARRDQPKAIAALIKAGCNPDERNSARRTSLHQAAQRGHRRAVKALLAAGADVFACDKDGKAAYWDAVESDTLPEKFVDDHLQENEGKVYTLLRRAAEDDDTTAVEILIHERWNFNEDLDERGNTPLHIAATNGHPDVYGTLVTAYAYDMQLVRNYDGKTALYIAVEHGHHEMVKSLPSYLVEPENYTLELSKSVGPNGRNVLHGAVLNGDIRMVQILVEIFLYSLRFALDTGTKYPDYDLCGIFLSEQDNRGNTALHLAAESGNIGLIEVLRPTINASKIYSGFTRRYPAKNKQGDTPLHIAVKNGHTDAVNTLLKNSQFRIDNAIITADDVKNLIVEYPSDTTGNFAWEEDGNLGLDFDNSIHSKITLCESVECSSLAEDYIELTDNMSHTPLHCAAQNGDPTIIKILLDCGADLHVNTADGNTPCDIAESEGMKEAAQILCEKD